MKTNEELNALKEEIETLKKKLSELTEEELKQVTGGNQGMDESGEINPRCPLKLPAPNSRQCHCAECPYCIEAFDYYGGQCRCSLYHTDF